MLARIQKTWISQTLPMEIQNDTDTWKIVWYCLKKLNIYMTQQSHSWVCIQKKETYVHTNTCTYMLTITLFVIDKRAKIHFNR